MSAVGTGSKYNVAINGVGYMLRGRGYNKRDAKIFAPRFGTGEMGEGDLDIWKSQSRTDFSGGMFQDDYDDLTKSSVIMGALRNTLNGRLYPTPKTNTGNTNPAGGAWESTVVTWTEYNGYLYFFSRVWDTGTYRNWLYRIDTSGTQTIYNSASSPALPAALMTATISDIAVNGGKMWVATTGNNFYSFDGTTWTSHTGAGFVLLQVFNGFVYGSDGPTTNKLIKHSGTVGDNSVTTIGTVGDSLRTINSLVTYNHRLYIGKPDGLYAYDGVQISTILDYSKQVDNLNFTSMAVLNGVLYFTTRRYLMKFDGATVSMVTDISQLGFTKVRSAYGFLWGFTSAYSSSYFADNLPAFTSSASLAIYAFDGLAWYGYTNEATQDTNNPSGFLMFFNGDIYYTTDGQGSASGHYGSLYSITHRNMWVATGARNVLTLDDSQFDGGFPNIDKVLEEIEAGAVSLGASDSLTAYYRYYDGQTWSSYISLGTITGSSTSSRLTLWKANQTCVFRKVQVRLKLTVATASPASIKDFAFKWFLSPDQHFEWNLNLLAMGQSDNQLQLVDGAYEAKTARALRDNIYQARQSDTPILFEDIDYTSNTNLINSSVTTITVGDTTAFKTSGFFKIDDEVIYYTGKTATTFTGCIRGELGTAAAGHSAGAVVNCLYRVVLTQISNESVIAPSTDSYGTESELQVILQEA